MAVYRYAQVWLSLASGQRLQCNSQLPDLNFADLPSALPCVECHDLHATREVDAANMLCLL